MTAHAFEIDAWPLAARMAGAIGAATNVWQVVIGADEAADALQVELESLYDGPVRRAAVDSVDGCLAAIEAGEDEVLLITLEPGWSEQDWRALDVQRSRMLRKGMTILVIGSADVAAMVTAAPNLWSWIAGMVWTLRVEDEENG